MEAHEFAELAEYLQEAGYPAEWVSPAMMEQIPYYGKEFSIVELMHHQGEHAIIQMDFDISKGSIWLENLTGHLLAGSVPRHELIELENSHWRKEHVAQSTVYDDLVPVHQVFGNLLRLNQMQGRDKELTFKIIDMNRNSLEEFQDQAKVLKMPAVMQAEIEKQMETNVDRIAVTVKFPSSKGHLEATAHLKRGGGDSEYYYFNKYDLAYNNKIKPLDNGYEYMVRTSVKDGVELEKPLLRSFDSPIAAIAYFKSQKDTSELLTGKVDGNKQLVEGQSLATMKDGKVDYVTKHFQPAYYNPVVENTVYVNKGVGFKMVQSANMLQGRSAFRNDLVSRQGEKYEAWNIYKFDEPRDNYGNLKVKQFSENYGFKLEDELARYEIKGLDDPKKYAELVEKLRDGERTSVVVELPGTDARKLDVEAAPRYGNINFYDREGQPVIREALVKPGMEKQKEFGPKAEQGKQKGQEAGMGI